MSAWNQIGGARRALTGSSWKSINPARPDEVIWQGAFDPSHVDDAVSAARQAAKAWEATDAEVRADLLRRVAECMQQRRDELADLILRETGKTRAESLAEAGALPAKINLTLDGPGAHRVANYETEVSETRMGHCRFRPHGVMAVVGPFNFPMHLPNGQIVPALAAGNTVVFKPSEQAPACGQALLECFYEAGIPDGVLSLVHGDGVVARALVTHREVDGVLFTGSWPVGRSILEANLDDPGRMIALEMGGNNAAIVAADAVLPQAVIECVRCAYATAGQRCTCTRRILVDEAVADRFIPALCTCASTLLSGDPGEAAPVFMGPVISEAAQRHVLEAQEHLAKCGGRVLVPCADPGLPGFHVTAGVTEVDSFLDAPDEEIFGPLVQVCRVANLEEAITQANATRYGLAASVFSRDASVYQEVSRGLKVGCLNWNTGTAGASSALPFGGAGRSGNHRPAAAFAQDFCAWPVASLEESSESAVVPEGMQWDDRWLRDG